MRSRKGLVTGLSVVVAIAAVGILYVKFLRPASTHTLTIGYPTASGLVPGSDVFEAGAKVGTVSDIVPDSGNGVIVTTLIDDSHWPLHDGLSAGIRPKSLLGEKYVDLHDGNTTRAFDAGSTLVAASDSTPVELDQFLNTLDPQSRSSVRTLVNDLGAGLAGRGRDLSQVIAAARADLDHLKVTGTTLNNRDPDLDTIIVGLDTVLGKLTTNDQLVTLSQLINNGQTTLNAIEAERASFSRQFVDAQAALTELNQVLSPTVTSLRNTLETAPGLVAILKSESDQLAYLGSTITTGNYLEILNQGLQTGPVTSGGARETGVAGYPNGAPIFRVCLALPGVASPSSCEGNGFHPPAGTTGGITVASTGGGSDLARLVGFVGA